MDVAGKVIAVSGAQGALGRTLVTDLLNRGSQVLALDITAGNETGAALLALGGVDAADPEAVSAALERGVGHFGGLDALVNVAGGFVFEMAEHGRLDTWDLLYRRNLRSAVCASQAALPHLLARGGGQIINVGALGAIKAGAGMGAYAASKAGVMRYTEALAEEFKDRGIRVNAVLPSIIDTPANRADMPDADHSRWVSPESLAGVIVFLLSPSASAITGALIPVAGRV